VLLLIVGLTDCFWLLQDKLLQLMASTAGTQSPASLRRLFSASSADNFIASLASVKVTKSGSAESEGPERYTAPHCLFLAHCLNLVHPVTLTEPRGAASVLMIISEMAGSAVCSAEPASVARCQRLV
jgi:hypothetical protein